MSTQTESKTPTPRNPFGDVRSKFIEAMTAYTEANQRVLGEIINLSSTAGREALRVFAELETAGIEAVRNMPALPTSAPVTPSDLAKDPMGGYRQAALAAGEGPQHLLKLFESQAQTVGQGFQRFQTSAERSGKEINEVVTGYWNRLSEIYRRA